MLRAALAGIAILLSGCLAADAPAALDEATVAADDDGMVVTATRVVPLVHTVDEHGVIQARACVNGASPEGDCAWSAFAGNGLDWQAPLRDFGDPAALFWRVSLHADWQSRNSLVTKLRMTVYATEPCGLDCLDLREVAVDEDASSPGFDALNVYLQAGETGVRVRLDPVGQAETSVSEARIDYHLHGGVGGYRAADDPVIIG